MKKILYLALIVSISTFLIGSVVLSKDAEVVLKAGLIDPPSHIDTLAIKRVADIVSEKTNGKVKIEVYPASQLGFATDLLQGMQLGTIEMFVGAVTWLGAFETDYWIPGTLYLFDNQQECREIHNGPYFDKLAETMRKKHGIRVLTQDWDRGARNFIATKPIKNIADLDGLKIRVPEQKSWIENFKMAGANPTPIALAETFTGLQQGIVSATEQASHWLFFNKYHTVADNLTLTNHNYEETGVFISERIYRSLDPEIQKIITETVKEVTEWHNIMLEAEIKAAEEKMNKEGVNIIEVNQVKWRSHFRSIIPELAKKVGYSEDLLKHIMEYWD